MNSSEENILLERLARVARRVADGVLTAPVPVVMAYASSDGEVAYPDCKRLSFRPIATGEPWGERWEVGWFRAQVEIPDSHRAADIVVRMDLGGEGLVYDGDGRVLQGLSSGSVFDSEFSRDLVHLDTVPTGQTELELWIEASACGLFGVHTSADPGPDAPDRYGHYEAVLRAAELCIFHRDRWAFWLDLESVRGIIQELPSSSTRRARLLTAVCDTLDDLERGASIATCRSRLSAEYGRPASPSTLTAVAIGHAHIDTAWLWPVRETVRKCARTFASQIKLLRDYPEYVFGASQPQHYQFVKDRYPELYHEIKDAVRSGRWEVQGGMWVEADCNLISGESMVRQILHGKNFFRDEFGVDVTNLWLPDVFGYSPALPQILRKSGIRYFLTQKMSWNQYNTFPHHTFRWRGIDGSDVVAHFPPEDTYNSSLRGESLMRGAARFRERGFVEQFLTLYGVGDGGGGPKEEHIEFGLRCRDCEGVPKVQFGTAESFFRGLDAHRDRLPEWTGELYLELHRGTLTTQARNKRWNRKLEYRLTATEKLWSCVDLNDYPADELTEIWQTLLRNQFHDILPGSSIKAVYDRTEEEYRALEAAVNGLQDRAVAALARPTGDTLLLFNASSYPFTGLIPLPPDWPAARHADGRELPCQRGDQGEARIQLEPHQFITVRRAEAPAQDVTEDAELILENELVRYECDATGRLVRAFDKEADRELLAADVPGNVLTLYEDRPNNWDAWDIDRTYERTALETPRAAAPARRFVGPLSQSLRFELITGSSRIEQTITLQAGSKRLDFDTRVEWQESHRMLRVAFPVDIRADEATFDIQYGHVRRPTHRNTSWDLARFEAVAQRYVDLSEPDYGVALLNDCKYGHKVTGQTIDLCLLRSPAYPDPDADRGEHRFVYSLLPHLGDLVASNVFEHAEALNNRPLRMLGYAGHEGTALPLRLEGKGAALTALKRAEKEDCLIARIVETDGCRSRVTLRFAADIARYAECDLLEWSHEEVREAADTVPFTLRPFEIRTVKLWRR